jgi:hypothetical protein
MQQDYGKHADPRSHAPVRSGRVNVLEAEPQPAELRPRWLDTGDIADVCHEPRDAVLVTAAAAVMPGRSV